MKKYMVFIFINLMTKILSGQVCVGQQVSLTEDGVCNNNPWVLVFEDNFEGNKIDYSKWKLPYQGVLNGFNFGSAKSWLANTGNLPAIPIENNIEVSNGKLQIIARKETSPITGTYTNWSANPPVNNTSTFEYTSGWIESNQKFEFGKFEIRCKIPKGKGFWPAFWTFGGPGWNEIDVFEFWNEKNVFNNYDPDKLARIMHMTAHFDFDGDGNSEYCTTPFAGPDFSEDFHTFTMIWDAFKIQWFVDGDLKRTSSKFYTLLGQALDCNSITALTPFIMDKAFPREPMAIIANLAVQTGFDGNGNNNAPDSETPFPSAFEIDYIRYYKQIPCNGSVEITDFSEFDFTSGVYNVIIGTEIYVNGDLTLGPNQQLTIIGRDEIILDPGFSTESGSEFSAYIDPSICSGVMRLSNPLAPNQDVDSISCSNIPKVKIISYPNPNNGIIYIESGSWLLEDCEIYIMDVQNKLVRCTKSTNKSSLEVDLNGLTNGLYILNIINPKLKEVFSNKIILSI